ncbi:MAG: complex I subunit 5 family protein [Desulfurococcales archaeon]|nr:complex I subunit 5 family protein [Desulfurococcales archaeon]
MIMDYPLLWITLIIPLIVSLIGLLVRIENARSTAYVGGFTLLLPAFIATYYAITGALSEGVFDPLQIDMENRGLGRFMLYIDGLSAPIVIGISIVTGFVSVYSVKYMLHRIDEMSSRGEPPPSFGVYYVLYVVFSVSMLGMAYSTNLAEFYIFLELSLLSSFALIAYYGYGDRRRIALLYFIWTHVAGALFLAGVLFYGFKSGTFDVIKIVEGLPAYVSPFLEKGYQIAAWLIIIGLFIKMAVFGVHMWLPYAHAEAPTPVSALLSPNLIGIAGYALARFALPLFPSVFEAYQWGFVALSFITIIYGGLVALRQSDFKRFLAYSSVSQMGYMLLGIFTLTAYGIGGSMLHYLSHAVGKAVLFMVAGVFIAELHGLRAIDKMGGLARRYPLIAAVSLLGFMHLVGIPPALGMWSEILITFGIVKAVPLAGVGSVVLLSSLIIVAFGVTAAYSFITMRRIFFGPLKQQGTGESLDDFKGSILFIAVLGVFFFIAITPFSEALRTASTVLSSLVGGG